MSVPTVIVVDVHEGPPGADGAAAAIVNANDYASPSTVTTVLPTTSTDQVRHFITGTFDGPTIDDGALTRRRCLYYTGVGEGVLKDKANLKLFGGEYIMSEGSQIWLEWIAGLGKWTESGRNNV